MFDNCGQTALAISKFRIVNKVLFYFVSSKKERSCQKKEQRRVGLPCNHQMEDSLLQEASDDKSPLGIDKAVEICKCLRGWIRSDRRSVDPHTYVIMVI